MSLPKRAFSPVLMFLYGVCVFVIAGIIYEYCDSDVPWKVVERWEIYESQEGHLMVAGWMRSPALIDLGYNPERSALDSASIKTQEMGPLFEFEGCSEFGVPRVRYTGGTSFDTGVTWVDFLADGRFEERFAFAHKRFEICIDNRWITAVRPDKCAQTEEGEFRFDLRSGMWQRNSPECAAPDGPGQPMPIGAPPNAKPGTAVCPAAGGER